MRFLSYCEWIKAFTSSFKLKNEKNLIALQTLNTKDLEGFKFSKKFRAKSNGDMEKLMGCVKQ